MTEMATQLYPIKILCIKNGQINTQLYFHTPENDNLYKIKDNDMHYRLKFMGTWRDIHLDDTEIIKIGNLQQFKQKKHFHIYYL